MYIKAIPTTYAGIEFRSRLEAKWAVFFDLCGWNWQYEPFDMDGWIPDFLLGKDVLVEVKPFTVFDQFDEAIQKASQSILETEMELLLLGVSPTLKRADNWDGCVLGWLGENCGELDFEIESIRVSENRSEYWPGQAKTPSTRELAFDEAVFANCGDKIDFFHSSMSYTTRVKGIDHRSYSTEDCQRLIKEKWSAACNTVKWMPKH